MVGSEEKNERWMKVEGKGGRGKIRSEDMVKYRDGTAVGKERGKDGKYKQ